MQEKDYRKEKNSYFNKRENRVNAILSGIYSFIENMVSIIM